MEVRRRRLLPAWTGSLLAALGLLVFVASYLLLPLFIAGCFDYCAPPRRHLTAWTFSLSILSHLPSFPVTNSFVLALCYLPLLAAVVVVGCLLGFLVRLHRAFTMWSHRVWLIGCVAFAFWLAVALFAGSLFGGKLEIGFVGLLFGYGLLWAGDRVVRNSV